MFFYHIEMYQDNSELRFLDADSTEILFKSDVE